jgi:hypothetical protein
MIGNSSTENSITGRQHTMSQTIVLHLMPGLLLLPVFLIAVKLTANFDLPRHLAPFLIASTLVIIPFETGYLLHQGKKMNGKYSLKGVILYRESILWWQYTFLGLPMLLWIGFIFKVVGPPVDSFFIARFFSWMPDSFFQSTLLENLSQYSHTSLVITGILSVILIDLWLRSCISAATYSHEFRYGVVGHPLSTFYCSLYITSGLPGRTLSGYWQCHPCVLLYGGKGTSSWESLCMLL